MATTFQFCEYNGAAVYQGPNYIGTTLTTGITTCNWHNLEGTDATALQYRSYPITAGNNSYSRFVFGQFSGSFNSIGNGLFAHTAGSFGDPGVTLSWATFVGSYSTPTTTNISGMDISTPIAITSGGGVLFSLVSPAAGAFYASVGPNSGTPSCYTMFLVTQLQTTTAARAGDTTQVTLTLRYDEN